jgi:endonuclease/exonuclease/phosphatase (EEP) superfamily protein YafD
MKLILNLVAIVGLGAPAAVALSALSGIGHRWPDILAQFTAPTLAVTLAFIAVLALLRLWPAMAAGSVVALLLAIAVWPQVAPGGPRPAGDGPSLKVYSANLWAQNTQVDQMAASIRDADADILILVEFGAAADAAIDQILAEYPHRALSPRIDRPNGPVRSAIASRYPLTRLTTPQDGLESIVVTADTPLGPVNLVGVHLTRPWPYQYQWGQIVQVQGLTQRISTLEGPVILAGDFNAVSTARIGRQVRQDNDLIPAPGWPGTWPNALPGALRITIDQVYHSPDLALVDRRLGRATGSDHRPVITLFQAPQSPTAAD